MGKTIGTTFIFFYQAICSPIIRSILGVSSMCRYSPTCSSYTKQMIIKHGLIKGGYLGARRLASCHPFAK